jgi:hypothetical protein
MVATSPEDMKKMLLRGLVQTDADYEARKRFIGGFFGFTADGRCAERVADALWTLSNGRFAIRDAA